MGRDAVAGDEAALTDVTRNRGSGGRPHFLGELAGNEIREAPECRVGVIPRVGVHPLPVDLLHQLPVSCAGSGKPSEGPAGLLTSAPELEWRSDLVSVRNKVTAAAPAR